MFSGSLTLSVIMFSTLSKKYLSPLLFLLIEFSILIIETNTLNYVLAVILSIVNKENEVHLVVFYFYTFIIVELIYDIYDKKLLAIFKAFKI